MDSEKADRIRRLVEARMKVKPDWHDSTMAQEILALAYLEAEEECEQLRRRGETLQAALMTITDELLDHGDHCGG